MQIRRISSSYHKLSHARYLVPVWLCGELGMGEGIPLKSWGMGVENILLSPHQRRWWCVIFFVNRL